MTEDKADVNARVAWSGVGIDLATNVPTPDAIRDAVRTALNLPAYRMRAKRMADEFAGIDTRKEILRIIGRLAADWQVSRRAGAIVGHQDRRMR
jgi:UDP:flavonoid glycosyltransferase YjiC (YdhE family)